MLNDQDRIFTNIYGFNDALLHGAKNVVIGRVQNLF